MASLSDNVIGLEQMDDKFCVLWLSNGEAAVWYGDFPRAGELFCVNFYPEEIPEDWLEWKRDLDGYFNESQD